jgi:hypothetical protein
LRSSAKSFLAAIFPSGFVRNSQLDKEGVAMRATERSVQIGVQPWLNHLPLKALEFS